MHAAESVEDLEAQILQLSSGCFRLLYHVTLMSKDVLPTIVSGGEVEDRVELCVEEVVDDVVELVVEEVVEEVVGLIIILVVAAGDPD